MNTRTAGLRFALIGLVPLSFAFALATGSVTLDAATLWRVLTGADSGLPATLVLDLRLPRAVSAFSVGGLLALAGCLLQALLRNPLADPYILGISGGGAVAALGALLLGAGSGWVSGSAFLGSLVAMLLVFGLSRSSACAAIETKWGRGWLLGQGACWLICWISNRCRSKPIHRSSFPACWLASWLLSSPR